MPRLRAQAAPEYMLLLAGVLLFVLMVFLVLRGGVIPSTSNKISKDVSTFFDKYSRYYLFYDNFDTNTADRWQNESEAWVPQNRQYAVVGGASTKSVVPVTLSNFSYTAFVKPSAGQWSGLVLRWQNSTDYYFAYVIPLDMSVGISRFKNNVATDVIAQTSSGLTPAAAMASGFYLRADANGTDFALYVNNVRIGVGTDDAFDRGFVGLRAGNVVFDDVRVFQCVGQCGA